MVRTYSPLRWHLIQEELYGILILGHQEYVTQKEYDNLKNFVANGGTITLY